MIKIPGEVRELIKQPSIRKNFRVSFPNGDREDITNKDIIDGTVSFDESICSRDKLKFGLCESSGLQFETLGVGNIKGKTIDASIEIDASSLAPFNYVETRVLIDESYMQNPTSELDFVCEPGLPLIVTSDKKCLVQLSVWYEDSTTEDFGDGMFKVENFNITPSKRIVKVQAWLIDNEYGNYREVYFKSGKEYIEHRSDLDYPVYSIPYGRFIVDSCERESSNMQRRKVQAYSVDYLDFTQIPGYMRAYIKSLINQKKKTVELAVEPLGMALGQIIDNSYSQELKTTRAIQQLNNIYSQFHEHKYFGNGVRKRDGLTFRCYLVAYIEGYTYIESTPGEKAYYYDFTLKDHLRFLLSTSFDDAFKEYFETFREDRMGTYSQIAIDSSIDDALNKLNEILAGMIKPRTVFAFDGLDRADGVLPEKVTFYNMEEVGRTEGVQTISHLITEVPIYNDNESWGVYSSTGSGKYQTTIVLDLNEMLSDEFPRKYVESFCELSGGFGKTSRTTNQFQIIYPTQSIGLYPSPTLFPSQTTFPRTDPSILITRDMYPQAWYDDEPTKKYSAVTCTYKNASDEEVTARYEIVEDATSDYQEYDISDNYIVENSIFTASQMDEILANIGLNIKDIQYYPSEVQCVGLPFVEVGDTIKVLTADGGFNSIVLSRTLSGINALMDNYVNRG